MRRLSRAERAKVTRLVGRRPLAKKLSVGFAARDQNAGDRRLGLLDGVLHGLFESQSVCEGGLVVGTELRPQPTGKHGQRESQASTVHTFKLYRVEAAVSSDKCRLRLSVVGEGAKPQAANYVTRPRPTTGGHRAPSWWAPAWLRGPVRHCFPLRPARGCRLARASPGSCGRFPPPARDCRGDTAWHSL